MPEAILHLLRVQFGLISTRQAYDGGLTRAQIRHLVATGEWVRQRRGVYRSAIIPMTWQGELMAELLDDALASVSHRSGARVWSLDGARSCRPEITIPYPSRGRRTFAIVHGSTQYDLFTPTMRQGLRVTPIDRTLIDVAGVVKPHVRTAMIDDALNRRLLTLDELTACLVRHSVQGRTGSGKLRADLHMRTAEEKVPLSSWSRWVAELLVEHGLPAPRFEVVIEDRTGFVAQVDLAYPELQIAIELDSVSFHLRRDRFTPDAVRRNAITNAGWHLLTVTWDLYTGRPADLVTLVADAREFRRRGRRSPA
ncbi:MAG: type IV toxin-antitoxin system AbiEi family antitoxin domain-containing protein [Actinomycetia bacterium]|nr:type IV toxin-antitoxin system AbiEi family antitoxin domain-containing protein [Actinomycetes bacterium]